jgi:hypothetical protein
VTNPSHSTKPAQLPPCLHQAPSTSSGQATPRWIREQIRDARKAPLAPLVVKRGLMLVELPAGNFAVAAFPGLIVKDSYWRWPERDQAGNSIDFLVQVLGLSFHDAMKTIVGS